MEEVCRKDRQKTHCPVPLLNIQNFSKYGNALSAMACQGNMAGVLGHEEVQVQSVMPCDTCENSQNTFARHAMISFAADARAFTQKVNLHLTTK